MSNGLKKSKYEMFIDNFRNGTSTSISKPTYEKEYRAVETPESRRIKELIDNIDYLEKRNRDMVERFGRRNRDVSEQLNTTQVELSAKLALIEELKERIEYLEFAIKEENE